MEILSVFNTNVRLEESDLIALVNGQIWIRSGENLYVSTQLRMKSSDLTEQLEVNSAGKYEDAEKRKEFPQDIQWVHYKSNIILQPYFVYVKKPRKGL